MYLTIKSKKETNSIFNRWKLGRAGLGYTYTYTYTHRCKNSNLCMAKLNFIFIVVPEKAKISELLELKHAKSLEKMKINL